MDKCVVRSVDGGIHVARDCPGLIDPFMIGYVEPSALGLNRDPLVPPQAINPKNFSLSLQENPVPIEMVSADKEIVPGLNVASGFGVSVRVYPAQVATSQ